MAEREGYSGWWVAGTVIFGVLLGGMVVGNVYFRRRYLCMHVLSSKPGLPTRLRDVALVGWKIGGSWLVVAYDSNGEQLAKAMTPTRDEAALTVIRSVRSQVDAAVEGAA